MMMTMLRCVGRMARHSLLCAIYTRLVLSWRTLDHVDLTSATVKSVVMMGSHMSLFATPEHMVSELTTQESALLKSKPLN